MLSIEFSHRNLPERKESRTGGVVTFHQLGEMRIDGVLAARHLRSDVGTLWQACYPDGRVEYFTDVQIEGVMDSDRAD